jgi:hypothetical protein
VAALVSVVAWCTAAMTSPRGCGNAGQPKVRPSTRAEPRTGHP